MVVITQNIKQKPGYKQTEMGMIPVDWKTEILENVCVANGLVRGPFGGSIKKEFFQKDGFKVYEQKNAIYRNADLGSYFVSEVKYKELKRFEVREREFIVSCSGTIGKIFQIPKGSRSGIINQALLKIKIDDSVIHDQFFFYVFDWDKFQQMIIDNTQGGAMQNLVGMDIFRNVSIPLPPLPEQQAIATALSDVDALIASLDKLIAKKQDIKQATIQQLLTGKVRLPGFNGEWEIKKFGEIFQFLNTANNSRSDLSEIGEIAYIHYGDIHTKWKTFLDCDHYGLPLINKNKVAKVPLLEEGDLIMADASEDYEGIGISVEVKNVKHRKIIAGLHTLLLRGDKKVLADGFKGYLQYIPAVKDTLKMAATGISVYGISKSSVKNIFVRLPDISEQQAIANILSDMDAEIAALEQRRDKTRVLKQGMMQELLTGKTRLL